MQGSYRGFAAMSFLRGIVRTRALAIALTFLAFVAPAEARAEMPGDKEFAVFDGRIYNGRFYPRIDIIEWGTPSHMEFHVYSKAKPVDISVELEVKTGKPVMLVRYLLKDRGESVCRRVLAPGHFKAGLPLFVYRDNSDSEMDNVLIDQRPLHEVEGYTKAEKPAMQLLKEPAKYAVCEEPKDDRQPAAAEAAPAKAEAKGHEPGDQVGGGFSNW